MMLISLCLELVKLTDQQHDFRHTNSQIKHGVVQYEIQARQQGSEAYVTRTQSWNKA